MSNPDIDPNHQKEKHIEQDGSGDDDDGVEN